MEKIVYGLYRWDSSSLVRLEYFVYSVLASIVTLALLASINPLLDLEGAFWVYLALFMLTVAVVHNTYTHVNLVRKRLRDMNYAQEHLWWIFGLWLVTVIHSWGEPDSTITYCLLALDLVVTLWLLVTPSVSGGTAE